MSVTLRGFDSNQAVKLTNDQFDYYKNLRTIEEKNNFLKSIGFQVLPTVQGDRQAQYGDFVVTAALHVDFMSIITNSDNWKSLSEDKQYAVTMITVKLARILNQGSEHKDNWMDIAGYAEKVLEGFE